MKIYKRYRTHLLLLIIAILFTACDTEVDLCYSTEHPHRSATRFSFNWTTLGDTLVRPDFMNVYADRVVNKWKCGMIVSASVDSTLYTVRQGEYKILSLNRVCDVFNYDALDKTAQSDSTRWNLDKMYLSYVPYDINSDSIKSELHNWTDYNSYSSFALNSKRQVFVGLQDIVKIDSGSSNKVTIMPIKLTQRVVMQFPLKKLITDSTQFRVDSMIIEMAGIPAVIYPYSNKVNVAKTYKMLSNATLTNARTGTSSDELAYDSLLCRVSMDVSGIVYGPTENEVSGPGIMQVILFTTGIRSDGNTQHKRIEGKINLYNPLRKAHLLDYEYGTTFATQATKYAFININTTLTLDSNSILRNSDGDWGIGAWIPCVDEVIVPME